MSERKALNKYSPPDFDPSKNRKLKRPKDLQYLNEAYLGQALSRFYIKCMCCLAEITFKTDPENADYTVKHGPTHSFLDEKLLEEEEKRVQKELDDEELNNPINVLENRTKDSKLEMEVLENLQELKDLNQRQTHRDFEAMLLQHLLSQEQQRQQQEEEGELETVALLEEAHRQCRLLEDPDSEDEASPPKPCSAAKASPTDILDEAREGQGEGRGSGQQGTAGRIGGAIESEGESQRVLRAAPDACRGCPPRTRRQPTLHPRHPGPPS
ncbi:hypothetical protein ACRRTK_021758 [Alexandromys fortis]